MKNSTLVKLMFNLVVMIVFAPIIVFAQMPMQQTDDPQMQQMLNNSVASAELVWNAPKDWVESLGSGMRMATFTVDGEQGLQCSVIALKGMAGGIDSNVSRWMSQVAIDVDEPTFQSYIDGLEVVDTKGGLKAHIVDLSVLQDGYDGLSDSMLASIIRLENKTVFFKMTGSLDQINGQKQNFQSLISSLKLE